MSVRIGSMFSGSGMLDEAVRSVIGGTVAWHCEYEPPTEKNPKPTQAAARVLAHRYPGVPNHGDVSSIEWGDVEPVDVLTGGFPCQDVSQAGKRAGLRSGTRSGQWASMCDAIDALRPPLVVIENVRGLTNACADSEMGQCPRCVDPNSAAKHAPYLRALGRVLGDLAEFGYDARWHGLPASAVGAPHERFRLFIVATDTADGRHAIGVRRGHAAGQPQSQGDRPPIANTPDDRHERSRAAQGRRDGSTDSDRPAADSERGGRDGWAREQIGGPLGRAIAARLGQDAPTDASGYGCREGWPESARLVRRPDVAECGAPTADAHGAALWLESVTEPGRGGASIAWGIYEPAIRRWEALTRPAPAPVEPGARGGRRLSRWFDEWMMGWPDGWVTDVPGITYREAIKICGNGVVRQQAAVGIAHLLSVAVSLDGAA